MGFHAVSPRPVPKRRGHAFMRRAVATQGGATLVEIVMAMGVTALIMAAITMSVGQVFRVNRLSSDSMVAIRQAQNAGYWVSRDSEMAQIVRTNTGGKFLVLEWTDFNNRRHLVDYTLENASGGLKNLLRKYDPDYDGVNNEGNAVVVGRNLDPAQTVCSYASGTMIFTVVAMAGGGTPEVRTYEVRPRPG